MEKESILQDLKRSNAILTGIIESPQNVVIFALDDNYRYIAFNSNHKKTMKAIWGVDIELGISMLDYIRTDEDRSKAKSNFDKALEGSSFIVEEEYGDSALERRYYQNIYNPITDETGKPTGLTLILTDITDQKKLESERNKLIDDLQQALDKVKMLSGLLPVCSSCKKIRDDSNNWQPIENYIDEHSEAKFSHSICPECAKKLYPGLDLDSLNRED
ncbi:MAG: PAS domain-containing protein [Spirochaetales bacterium]|nr:PAS domain-containing protein [Spirochaetales bacterium]